MTVSKGDMLRSSQYVDLSDEQLKELLGFLWQAIKDAGDAMKNDVEIEELQAKIKDLKAYKFTDAIKANKKRLKAARAIASLRSITWDVPTE